MVFGIKTWVFKVQLRQEHMLGDHLQCPGFADWLIEMHENNLGLYRKIMLTIGYRDRVI